MALIASAAVAPLALAGGPPEFEPVPGSVEVLPARAADPAGGLPWALRTFRSSFRPPRGGKESPARCLEIGRMQGDTFGKVDKDGKFVATPETSASSCGGEPPAGMSPAMSGFGVACPRENTCRGQRGLRKMYTVFSGYFGPGLTSVSFTRPGHKRIVAVAGGGAYIQVFRGTFNDANIPNETVHFANGCTPELQKLKESFGNRARQRGCRLSIALGFLRPKNESAASKRARRHPSAPVPVSVEPTSGSPKKRFDVSFRAPIDVAKVDDGYSYRVRGPGGEHCDGHLDQRFLISSYRFRRGKQIKQTLSPIRVGNRPIRVRRWCRGTFTVEVAFNRFKPFGKASFTVR